MNDGTHLSKEMVCVPSQAFGKNRGEREEDRGRGASEKVYINHRIKRSQKHWADAMEDPEMALHAEGTCD